MAMHLKTLARLLPTFTELKYKNISTNNHPQIIIPCQELYGVCLGLVKTSLMILYLRIFGTKRKFRYTIYCAMAIVWGWAFSIVIEAFLPCRPFPSNWDPTVSGKCGNRKAAFVAAGALNMLTDIMVLALPVPYIWSLQLAIGKIGLLAIFCLGIFVSIISIIRMTALLSLSLVDATYSLPDSLMWSVVEPELAIICANLPIMRPFFARITARRFESTRSKSTGLATDLSKKRFERLDDSKGGHESILRSGDGFAGDVGHGVGGKGRPDEYQLKDFDGRVSDEEMYAVGITGGKVDRKYGVNFSAHSLKDSDSSKSEVKIANRGATPRGIRVQQDFRVDY